jgi:mRNA interferase RelE/StbE
MTLTYTVIIPKTVKKQLDALSNNVYKRIAVKIKQLAKNPRPEGVVKLKGTESEYRIRIGNYRLRYEINDEKLIILLLKCKHRKDVYRG